MDLITYGLLNKAKANLDSPAFTGTPTAPTPATTDNTTKLATTEFVRSFVATLKGFYLGVTTTTLVDEVTTSPDVVINGETITAQEGNWVINSESGQEFAYSGTVWQKFGDSNWISVIGNTYNPGLTYNTGDYVIYMNGFYKCKQDNVTDTWDSTKWDTTTIADELQTIPDMIGATSSVAGKHGFVPTPAAGDNEKYLRGDGTWVQIDRSLTQEEYDALSYAEKHNGMNYFIIDNDGDMVKLNSLVDVNITSPSDGQVLQRSGDKWINNNLPNMSGATTQTAGTKGLVPAPAAGDNAKFLRGDGTWQNTPTPSDMTGATSGAAGTHGLVPAPAAGNQAKFLRGDGTWQTPAAGIDSNVIAEDYNSTQTYNIADYCMYNGKMYKCNTANTTGAWDSAKWDETCVGDELTLKTAVIVAPRVDQTATYTYNGTEQTLAFEYINSNNTIVTGNKHTDAGTYTCTVSLKNPNDLWSDTMDNVDKTFTWTINKVTSSITLSPTTFYFDNGTPQTLTATVVGQPLVLSGYDTNLITITQVSVVSGVYTYNIKATGTAGTTTITASIAESTNYTAASATASVETEAFTPGATLVPWSSGTDQEITDMINSYYNGEITLEDVKSVWSIGDVRNVDISAMTATGVGESHRAQTVEMEILDFDHDTLTTPVGSITKALITVDMKNCLRDANVTDTTGSSNTEHGYMNSSNTNVGGWTSCARRTWCNNVFYNALPAYFKALVKPVDKLTSAGNTSATINTDSDYCFLLSEIEIFGTVSYSKAGEGSQYAWFANATANRYKLPKWNGSSVSDYWWERSPRGSNSTNFCLIYSYGYADGNPASNAYGLAPACCL